MVGWVAVLSWLIPEHWQEARLLSPIHRQGPAEDYSELVFDAMGPAADQVPLRSNYYMDQAARGREIDDLLREFPDDPARYRLYARWFSYLNQAEVLPSDYREQWKTLDPGNALWGIDAANVLAGESIKEVGGRRWKVHDEVRFLEALAYLHEASLCEDFLSRTSAIQDLQLRSFKREESLKSLCMEQYLSETPGKDQVMFFAMSRGLDAWSERLEATGDKEGMRSLMQDLRKIVTLVLESNSTEYFSIMELPRSAPRLATRCRSLGLEDEAVWLDRLRAADDKLRAEARAAGASGKDRLASSTTSRALMDYAPAITPEAIKSGRLAEYAVADRFAAVAGLLACVLVLAGGLVEMTRRREAGALARGVMPLFRASDRAWVVGLGVGLPLLWWLGIVHGSPLGCRDIGLTYFKLGQFPMMQPWLSQDLGGLVLAGVLLVQAVRWRWAKRGALLALNPGRMWIGWTMVFVAALYLPLMGIVRVLPDHGDKFLLFGSALGGIPLLWLFWQLMVTVFAPRDQALPGQLLVRTSLPAVALLALLLLAAVPLFRANERNWMAKDELSKRDPEGSGLTVAERLFNDPIRQRLLEALR